MEQRYLDYTISDDPSRLQPARICAMLDKTYWAKDRPPEVTAAALDRSLSFGVYDADGQIGFARCVTDYATVYWLCDVVIDEAHRGKGVGEALVTAVLNDDRIRPLMGILATSSAHKLYEKFGFTVENNKYMRRPRSDY